MPRKENLSSGSHWSLTNPWWSPLQSSEFPQLFWLVAPAIFQVTNQMVTACKNYLTDRGVNRVWDQPRQPLIEKLKACLRLNEEYQKCFQRTKRRIAEDPTMKPFEFSEMYIFGKFDTFCKRLNQVSHIWRALPYILHIIIVFLLSHLESCSHDLKPYDYSAVFFTYS